MRKPEIHTDLTLSANYLRTFTHFFFTSLWSIVSRRVKIRKSFDSEVTCWKQSPAGHNKMQEVHPKADEPWDFSRAEDLQILLPAARELKAVPLT